MRKGRVLRILRDLELPPEMIKGFPRLPRDVQGLLMYGSRARGDALPDSDLDLLALVPSARASITRANVSVSFYTSAQLATGVGTLFGAHLRRDSRVLWDPAGSIAQSVGSMGDVDTARLRRRVKAMTTIFTTPEMDLPKYLEGMVRHARYLLRSSLYSQAIEQGEPCFSVRELEDRLKDPGLAAVLASRRASAATEEELADCLKRLEAIVGAFPANHHGSLEATVVNEWGRRGDILSGAFLVLGSSSSGSVYAEVDKILL